MFYYKAKDIEKDDDFFKTTSEREFNEYMNNHEVDESFADQSGVVNLENGHFVMNPSANPVTTDHDSQFSRKIERIIL